MTVNNVVVPIAAVRIPYQRKPTVMSKIRLFSLILAILTVFSAFSLSSCGKNPPDGGQTETEETTVEATEPPAPTTLCLLKDKEPLVRVIRPEGAAAESETV